MSLSVSMWLKRCLLALAACTVVAGMSAQAQAQTGRHFMNWYQRHSTYMSRCYPQAINGQYGRMPRDNVWCVTNQRFSHAMPDRPWQAIYPWDRGRMNDHSGR